MSADLVDVVLRNLMALSRIHRVGGMERRAMPNPDGSVVHFVRLRSADACFGLVHAGTDVTDAQFSQIHTVIKNLGMKSTTMTAEVTK